MMLGTSFSPWPFYAEDEIAAVSEVLKSGRVSAWTGTHVQEFEDKFKVFAGAEHAIAVANGTVALDLALQGVRIGAVNGGDRSDEVIVTPRSFIASASAVVNAGATPVFVDVDAESQNISAEAIRLALNEKTRGVICVHLAGWPCDMDEISKVIRESGLNVRIIEDCAQAHGALYRGRPVGGLGDVAAWSFCQDKIMTTGGEGGMVTCNDVDLWKRMWSFKDHGKSWDKMQDKSPKLGYRWVHDSIGTNWRMTAIQAVIGSRQLEKMSGWRERRAQNAKMLTESLRPLADDQGPIHLPQPVRQDAVVDKNSQHAFYKYYAFVRPENLNPKWDRDRIVREINVNGAFCAQGTCSEIYREKAFSAHKINQGNPLSVAHKLGADSIMFLVHPTLTAGEIARTARCAVDILSQATAQR